MTPLASSTIPSASSEKIPTTISTSNSPLAAASTAPRRTAHIAIDIPKIPAPYVPGSGPVSRDATIIPVHDSTAYIIGRTFIPEGAAADGNLRPKSLTWLVGFRDRPAARLAVRAHQVLDYVSPRELEDYEYKQWLCRQEELDSEAKSAVFAATKQRDETPVKQQAVKKARGRKPKKKFDSRVLTEPQTTTTELQTPATKPQFDEPLVLSPEIIPAAQNDSLSLSSKKRKLSDANPVSISKLSEAAHIQKYLQGEILARDGAILQPQSNDGNSSELNLMGSDIQEPVEKPQITSLPGETNPSPTTTASKQALSILPVPKSLDIPIKHTDPKETQPAVAVPKAAPRIISFTPIQSRAPGWVSVNRSQQPRKPSLQLSEPASESLNGRDIDRANDAKENDAKENDAKENDAKEVDSQQSLNEGESNTEELGDDEYIVEAIKDVKSKRGKLLFLVCWAGDWPPDQKHTWEPFENINEAMTRSYLAAHPDKAAATHADAMIKRIYKREERWRRMQEKKKPKLDKVMSAFEGDKEWLEDDQPLVPEREEHEEREEEIFVVTEK